MDKNGFTLIEILLVIAITVILLSFSAINLLNFQQSAVVLSSVEQVISDIKFQQTSAMNGVRENNNTAQRFGIRFNDSAYILFHGESYNPLDSTNLNISLGHGARMNSLTFPQSEILFEKGSGEIVNYLEGQNTITVTDSNNVNKTKIVFNKLGTVINIEKLP